MKMLLKLAWRNVLRNKRRTFLSGTAVGITLASLMLIDGLYVGMLKGMIMTATDTFLGQGQIHAKGFSDTLEVEKTINGSENILASLNKEPLLEAYSPRTASFAMLSSPAGVTSVLLYGIDPAKERNISMVDETIRDGEYLQSGGERQILIGSKAAETLEAGLGDRLVLTVAQAGTGELSQEMFRVSGIYHMGIREADSGMAFIHIDKARQLLALAGGTHEIVLKFKDLDSAGDKTLSFWQRYSVNNNEALGWRDLIPQLDGIIEMTEISTIVTSILVFGIVAVIIMNALFMSLYERMFEFGVLRAVGTRPLNMALIIFFEAAALSAISIIMGLVLGLGVVSFFSWYGIDYRGIEFAGVTVNELLYPELAVNQFTIYPLLIFIFSLVAAIYPALFAAKMTPARAMQRSM